MTKLSEQIVGKIKCEHIAPVPRWHFLIKSYVFWGLFVASVILGSLSFGVIEHIAASGDFDLIGHLQGSVLTSTVMMLPYFWLSFLLLFALVAYYNWKHTKMGYRFKRRWVFLASLVLSFFFGSAFYALGFGKKIDLLMIKASPFYNKSKHDARIELWQQPDRGLLIGKIVEVNGDETGFIMEDGKGIMWSIGEQDQDKKDVKKKEIKKKGTVVKIVGKKSGERSFEAKDIRGCDDCDGDDDDYGGVDDDEDGN